MSSPVLSARSWAALVLLAAIWGASFLLSKIALKAGVPPLTLAMIRMALAAAALWIYARAKGFGLPRGRVWGALALAGLLNNALPFGLIFWGQRSIESGLAAILNALTAPLSAIVAALVLTDEKLTAPKLIGAVLGVIGVAVVMGPEGWRAFDLRSLSQLAVVAAALSYAVSAVWNRLTLGALPRETAAAGMLTSGCLWMIPAALLSEGAPALTSWSLGVWAAILGLALLCTAAAYMMYFALLRTAGAANISLVTVIIPAFSVVYGAIFLGERLPHGALLGFMIIALGLIVIDGRLFRFLKGKPDALHS